MSPYEFLIPFLSINHSITKYIITPSLLIFSILCLIIILSAYQEKRVIEARGGIRKIYSELFSAIKRMPENKILSETTTSVTATYLNYSNKNCKIKVQVFKDFTLVSFSIRHHDSWVKTSKLKFEGSFSGGSILWKIIINFPDCDLSDS